MLEKIELYGVVLLLLGLGIVGAYFKGRSDERDVGVTKQLAANATVFKEAADRFSGLLDTDAKNRQAADQYMVRVNKGLSDVQKRFGSLPSVVVDPGTGCPVLGDVYRLRFDAIGASINGHPDLGAGTVTGPLPDRSTPPPR